MTNQVTTTDRILYEQDFNLWVEETIKLLSNGQFKKLDLEHLIEEIEGLTKSDKRELESRLTVLLEHLLKLTYWLQEKEQNQREWILTVKEQRRKIKKSLKYSPSLKPWLLSVLAECYEDAVQDVIDKSGLKQEIFPQVCSFSIARLLDNNWFPN